MYLERILNLLQEAYKEIKTPKGKRIINNITEHIDKFDGINNELTRVCFENEQLQKENEEHKDNYTALKLDKEESDNEYSNLFIKHKEVVTELQKENTKLKERIVELENDREELKEALRLTHNKIYTLYHTPKSVKPRLKIDMMKAYFISGNCLFNKYMVNNNWDKQKLDGGK
jgi:predicted RNase H-like nuclease (RuvC/YqgF family)